MQREAQIRKTVQEFLDWAARNGVQSRTMQGCWLSFFTGWELGKRRGATGRTRHSASLTLIPSKAGRGICGCRAQAGYGSWYGNVGAGLGGCSAQQPGRYPTSPSRQ
jgi:hypothetical protein